MKFGFIPIEGEKKYQDFVEEVLIGEEVGFDSVWLEEHHGVSHYWPSPLIGLAGIALKTTRLILGTDVMVLPFYHPVRVAEDIAMLDIMSGGRVILGTAIGYKPDEFSIYQVPMEKRGERFAESIDLIKNLWTCEEVNFKGKYYQVQNLKIEPQPFHKPHPPIWIGGWGKLSLSRAAQLGDAWLPGPTANLDKLIEAQTIYHSQLKAFGKNINDYPIPLTRDTVIAETSEEAEEIAQKHLLISYRDEYGGGKWKHPLIGNQDKTPTGNLDDISRDRFLIGNPDEIIRLIQTYILKFRVDHLILRLSFTGISHEFILNELKLLSREVMPVFKGS